MKMIKHKPMSVNQAWQGKRFRTPLYKRFSDAITLLLRSIRPPKPTGTHLFAHYIWGVSNFQADVDNPTKPFQDVLFNSWNMKNKDHRVEFMILEKIKTKKGDEFIAFHVDDTDSLVEYLEKIIERLKK